MSPNCHCFCWSFSRSLLFSSHPCRLIALARVCVVGCSKAVTKSCAKGKAQYLLLTLPNHIICRGMQCLWTSGRCTKQ